MEGNLGKQDLRCSIDQKLLYFLGVLRRKEGGGGVYAPAVPVHSPISHAEFFFQTFHNRSDANGRRKNVF